MNIVIEENLKEKKIGNLVIKIAAWAACLSLSSAETLVLRSEVDDSTLSESLQKHEDEQ